MTDPYEDETRERWGDTPAYAESRRRMARYRPEDVDRAKAEMDAIADRLAALCAAGVAPTDPAALAAAEEHRRHIDRWWYPCPPPMHAGLGAMYVGDPRFTAYWEDRTPGLAAWVADAFAANAASRDG